MKKITEAYPVEKFWKLFARQNRAVSKWDDTRTDMAVFINRTIRRWFTDKFFQVEREFWPKPSFIKDYKQSGDDKYFIHTYYVYIYDITFGYTGGNSGLPDNTFNVKYLYPHSQKGEHLLIKQSDMSTLKIKENEEDWRILHKFYPIQVLDRPDYGAAMVEAFERLKAAEQSKKENRKKTKR